jgi:hypothetical protein
VVGSERKQLRQSFVPAPAQGSDYKTQREQEQTPPGNSFLAVGKLSTKRNAMKTRILLAAGAICAFATPAFADFYIVRESPSAQCRIVEQRPTDTKIIIGGNKVYASRAEAEREMTVVCKLQ